MNRDKWKPVCTPLTKSSLFSSNVPALQHILDKEKRYPLIGLEYVIEVQQTDRNKGAFYTCRLCSQFFDGPESLESIRRHLDMLSHKIRYLNKHFQLIKKRRLEPPRNTCTEEKVDTIVKLIEEVYGRMKINLVIGQQLYHANSSKLDEEIEKNFHFEEDTNFVAILQQHERDNDPRRPPSSRSGGRRSHSVSPPRFGKDRRQRQRSSGSPRRRDRRVSSPRIRRNPSPDDLRTRLKSSQKSKKSRRDSTSKSKSRSRSKSLLITITRTESRSNSRGERRKDKLKKKRKRSKARRRRGRSSSSSSSSREREPSLVRKKTTGRRKRQQSSDKPLTIPTKSKEKEDESFTNLRSQNDTELSDQYDRVRFLKEEGTAVSELVQEKKTFIKTPTKHPLYNKQWRLFWRRKEKEFGEEVRKMDLTTPWIQCWTEFLDNEFKEKCDRKKRELEIKYKIKSMAPKINPIGGNDIVTLSGSESDEVVEITDEPPPLPPEVVSHPSTSKTKVENLGTGIDTKPNLSSKENVKIEKSMYQVPEDELNVLSLLKILLALASKGLIDSSERVKKMQNFALTLEDSRFGSSQMLVNERECYNIVDQAGESLKVKLSMGQVPEIHKKPVQLALDQIKLFLAKSDCQKSDILEVANFSPVRSEDLGETKMKIAKTIEQELRNCNRVITQDEFNKLVEAEYVRVKYKISSNTSSVNTRNTTLEPPVSQTQPSASVSELFSAYLNPAQAGPGPPHVSSHHSEAPGVPGVPAVSGIQPVDWNQICRALEVAKSLNRRSPPKSVPNVNGELEEMEIVALILNVKKLNETDKQSLYGYMKELERLDPEKVKRIKKKLIDSKRNM